LTELLVFTYDDEESGRGAFDALDGLVKQEVLTLADAALATKDQKGKVKIKQTLENAHTGSAALWGGFWGLLIGLLFLAPIFWGLVGALLGGILGKTTDIGIDNNFIKEVGESLEPGGAALFMLVAKATPDKVVLELEKYGGRVYQTSLSAEDEENLKKALEHDQVSASADEMLELE
jgi:uncharacterized membrane protein